MPRAVRRHRRLRERRTGAASLRAPGRARLLQRHHSSPRARTPGGAKDGPRAVREAADAGGQHGAAQRPGAAETRHQGRPAPRKPPAEPVPGDRHQRRRLSPGLAAGGPLRDAVLRQLRGAAARSGSREPGAGRAGADARHAVRGLRARSAPGAEQPARPRRIRCRARHPRDHRQPLAPRLRARPSRPRGRGLECRARTRSRRAAALRPHRHREFRCRRGRLHARGDRPGLARGQRSRGGG